MNIEPRPSKLRLSELTRISKNKLAKHFVADFLSKLKLYEM